jgi:hypothetical protein
VLLIAPLLPATRPEQLVKWKEARFAGFFSLFGAKR